MGDWEIVLLPNPLSFGHPPAIGYNMLAKLAKLLNEDNA